MSWQRTNLIASRSRLKRPTQTKVPGFQGNVTGQGFKVTGFQPWSSCRVPGFQGSRVPRFQEYNAPRFQGSRVPRFQEYNAPRFQDSRVPRFQEYNAPRFQGSRVPRFQDYTYETKVSRLHLTPPPTQKIETHNRIGVGKLLRTVGTASLISWCANTLDH